jgi:uncharacterized protein YukE
MFIRIFFVFLCIFLLFSFCKLTPESTAGDFIQQNKTTEIMALLAFTNKEDEIGKKWEEFLAERNHRFTNKDYQIAIHSLEYEYDQSYAMLNACVENTNKEAKEYSSSWSKDLKKQFGSVYVQNNFETIRFTIVALSMINSIASCEDKVKEAIYREYRYLDATKYYIMEIVEFSEALDEEEKMKSKVSITAANSYLINFEYPLQSIFSGEGLKGALFTMALRTHKDMDPQMIDFFTHRPLFMKPFALVKALNDLKALQEN